MGSGVREREYIPVQRRYETGTVKDNLILAGIEELGRNGLRHFSLRRVSASCGVSCAAPYKHFRDKEDFLFSVVEYVNDLWTQRQKAVLRGCAEEEPGAQLLTVCMEYLHFLVERPHVRAILTMQENSFGGALVRSRQEFTPRTQELFRTWCRQAGLSREAERCKSFVLRTTLYGSALLIGNDEAEHRQTAFAYVRRQLALELNLPEPESW